MSRHKDLLTYWSPEVQKAIEIGALAAPLFPPTDHRVRYVDHVTTDKLRIKYAGAGDRLINNIVDVSYVWESGSLKPRLQGWYPLDLVGASHVIEHVPNFVGWLNALSDVLSPQGHVSLAVPFKEQTFDCRRPVSTLGDVLEAWMTGATRPALRHVVDQRRYGVRVDGHNCWVGDPTPDRFSAVLPKVEGLLDFLDQWAGGHYIDSHVWVFSPASFQEIVDELRELNLIDLDICKGPTLYGHEFVVHLRRVPNAGPRRSRPQSMLAVDDA
jgi:hypothetical protein